jgi:hypothetical protein
MDYVSLSLEQIRRALDEVAKDAEKSFGVLDSRQLNWRPDETSWSVAQCLEHMVTSNRLMVQQARAALDGTRPRTIWEKLPVWPSLFGRMLIRSQGPRVTRKFKAPSAARPASSAIPAEIVERFIQEHCDMAAWVGTLKEDAASGAVMTSPFAKVITYSVLDGCRLIVTHDHRHIEQARRVCQSPGFPGGSSG